MSIFSALLLLTLFRHPSADALRNEYMGYHLLRANAEACDEYEGIIKELVPRLLEGDDLVSLVRKAEAEHAILCERNIGTSKVPPLPTSGTTDEEPERTRCHKIYLNAATAGAPGMKDFWKVLQDHNDAVAVAITVLGQMLGVHKADDQATTESARTWANWITNMLNGFQEYIAIKKQPQSVGENPTTAHQKLTIIYNHLMQMQGNPPSKDDGRQTQSKTCTVNKEILDKILTEAATVAKGTEGIEPDWRIDPVNESVKKSPVSKKFAESLIRKYPGVLCKYHAQATVRKFHHKVYCSWNKGVNTIKHYVKKLG